MPSDLELIFQGTNLVRLLGGLWVSVEIALLSMVASIILGVPFGVIMTSRNWLVKLLCRIYLEFVRIMPQLVLLFLVFFDLTKVAGINLDGKVAAVIVFTIWGTAEMGDLVRGSITSIPRHQFEAARALGMSPVQVQRHVVLPLAVRQLVPQTVNLTTRMIKTTSLVVLIGVVEVLKVAQQIIDANRFDYPSAALWIYAVVFFLYFIVCYPISWLSRRLEARWQIS